MRNFTEAEALEITDIEKVLGNYVEAQVWIGQYFESEDSNGIPLDMCTEDDLPDELLAEMRADVENFCEWVREGLTKLSYVEDLTPYQLGHDFALTRNRHGAGFWDRGWGVTGDWLTEAARSFGESDLVGYPDKDGKPTFHLSN